MQHLSFSKLATLSVSGLLLGAAVMADKLNFLEYWDSDPLVNIAIPIFVIAFILLFLRVETLYSWLIFSLVSVPLILKIIFSISTEGGLGLSPIFGRDMVSIVFAILFFVLSLLLIAYKSWRLRKR